MSEMKFSAPTKQKMEIVMSCSCGLTPRILVDAYDTKYVERLQAENVRLREALSEIVKSSSGCECCTEGALNREDLGDVARAALEEK